MLELQTSDRSKDSVHHQIQGPELTTPQDASTKKAELVATGDISQTLDVLRKDGTSTEAIQLVEKGTKVSLPTLDGTDTFTATVVGHQRIGNEVFTIVQAGPDYPTPNQQFRFSPQDFENTFRAKLDQEAKSERLLNTIVQDILEPELDKKQEITLKKENEIIAKAKDLLMDNDLDDEVPDVVTGLQDMIKNHNADYIVQPPAAVAADAVQDITPKAATTKTETQTKRITTDELKDLQKLPADQFVAKVVAQLTTQFPDRPIPLQLVLDQSLLGRSYGEKMKAKEQAKTKSEVTTAIENALKQHNETVLVKVDQRVNGELNKLITSANGKELTPEALADLRKNLMQLVLDTGAGSYIKLRNDIDARIQAYNNSILDQEISDIEDKYSNQTKELLTQHPTGVTPDDEAAFLQKLAAELKDTRSPKYIASLQQSVSAQIAEHRNQLAKKAEAEKQTTAQAARTAEIEQIVKDNPNIKAEIDTLTNKLAVLIQSPNLDATGQQQNLDQIVAEASALSGMTPSLLKALKGNWNELVKTHTEQAPLLAQVKSLVAPYLEKTDVRIGKDAITEVATALNAIPNLTAGQRNALLKDILNRFNEHNQNLPAKVAAAIPPPLPKKVDLPPIPQSRTKNKPEAPTPLGDDAYEISDDELEPATLIERDMSDPSFNAKADELDVLASKLQNKLTSQSSNQNELIDAQDLHNQLVNLIVDADLSAVSLEAKKWLAEKEETISQIKKENQELNKIEEIIEKSPDTITTILSSNETPKADEIKLLQANIDSLPNSKQKTELLNLMQRVNSHTENLYAADNILHTALSTDTEITLDLESRIRNLIPEAADKYLLNVRDLIEQHNEEVYKAQELNSNPVEDTAVSPEEAATDAEANGISLVVDQLAAQVLDELGRNEKLHTAWEEIDHDAKLARKKLFDEGKKDELVALARRACSNLGIDLEAQYNDIRTSYGENDVEIAGYTCDKNGDIMVLVNVFEKGSKINLGQEEIGITSILEVKLTEKTIDARNDRTREAALARSTDIAKQLNTLDSEGRKVKMKDAVDQLVANAWPQGEAAPIRTLGRNAALELTNAIDKAKIPADEKALLKEHTKGIFDAEQKRLKEAFDAYHAAEALAQTPAANTNDTTITTPSTADVLSAAPIATVIDTSLVTPDVAGGQGPDTNTTIDTSQVAPVVSVTSDPVATPTATVVDVPLPAPAVVASASPDAASTIDTTKVAPAITVTPDPIAVPAPQADVLGVAPVVTPVDVPVVAAQAAPKPDVRSTPAAEMTPEQKLSFEKSRDQIIDQVEKSLILSDDEKTRLVIKAVELLRTADKNTNVLAELQKLMVAGERHQAIQDALLNSEQIADQIQTAVIDALDTNSLDHKTSDAAFQEVLANLPTEQARASLQAIYDQAIGDKKLRGNPDKIKALVEKALADQADQNSSRTESLKPLFKKINAEVKSHVRQGEAQVLGSQTIEPSLADWEKPVPTEAELAAEKMTRAQKLRQKLGGFVDRIRGKAADTTTEDGDNENETIDTPKSQADIVAGMVDSNPDLTAGEKAKLKATVLELLEKGTDINKTLEQLKLTLANRDEVNKAITALVLNAPDLSKQMYFTLSAALQGDLSEEKRREALTKWQTTVDSQLTDRAKQVLKQVYQTAMQAAVKNPKAGISVDRLEDMIANGLAETGMIEARRDAVLNLVNTLSTEINKAITARKGPDEPKQSEVLADQPKAAEIIAQAVPDQVKGPEVVDQAPQVSEVLAAQPKAQAESNDTVEQQRKFLVGIESLIASAKKIGVDLDQATLHMYALKSDQLDKALLGDTLAKIDQLLAGKALDLTVVVNTVVGKAAEKVDAKVENIDLKLNDQLVSAINTLNLQAQTVDRDVSPREFFASNMDQALKILDNVNDPDLRDELRSIRNYLVSVPNDQDIGNEPLARLEKVLAKYPELLATVSGFISRHIKDHNNRKAMASEIAQREKTMMDNIQTATPESIRTEIKTLEKKFSATINRHGVDIALALMNDKLREAQNTEAATKEIAEMWNNDLTLNLDKISQILASHQLDRTILDKVTDFAKAAGKIQNKATSENRDLSDNDRSQILFSLIPNINNVPPALKVALATKMTRMFGDYNKRRAAAKTPQALAS